MNSGRRFLNRPAWAAGLLLGLLAVVSVAASARITYGLPVCQPTFAPECDFVAVCGPCDLSLCPDTRSFSRHAPRGFGICADGGVPFPSDDGEVHVELPHGTEHVTPCPDLLQVDGTVFHPTPGATVGEITYPPYIDNDRDKPRLGTLVCTYRPTAAPVPDGIPPLTEVERRQANAGTPRCGFGNPCDAASGNKFEKEVDYTGGLRFERFYNSQQVLPVTSMLGPGWSHTYSARAFPFQGPSKHESPQAAWVDVLRPDGRLDRMRRRNDGSGLFASGSDPSLQMRFDDAEEVWVIYRASGDKEIYDPRGYLLRLEDRAGRRTVLTYEGTIDAVVAAELDPTRETPAIRQMPRLTKVTGPFGRTLELFYSNDRLDHVRDPAGNEIRYRYDGEGRLAAVTYPDAEDPGGRTRTYHYEDPNDPANLTRITDENGEDYAFFAYDDDDRAIRTEHATLPGRTVGQGRVTFVYGTDPATGDPTTTVTDAEGHARVLTFPPRDGRRLPTRQSLPDGSLRAVSRYDDYNRPEETTDERGNRTARVYDDYHLIETIEALGTALERHTAYRYLDSTSQLVTRITETSVHAGPGGPADKVTTTEYAEDPTAPGARLPLPHVIRTDGFTPDGTPVSRETTLTWEPRTLTLPDGSTESVMFLTSLDGPRTDVEDLTRFTYYETCPAVDHCGRLGRLRSISRENAETLPYLITFDRYDEHGRVLEETDPNGLLSRYRYDLRGRLIERTLVVEGGALLTTGFIYDAVGQLVEVVLPDGASVRFAYDAAHQLTSVRDDLGDELAYGYDLNGDRTQVLARDPAGVLRRRLDLAYDVRERVRLVNRGQTSSTAFAYDGAGNVTSVMDPRGFVTLHGYDSLDRLAETVDARSGTVRYRYDAADRLVEVTDANDRATSYRYDDLGNLLEVRSPASGLTQYAYDPAGNRVAMLDARGVLTTYTYDALNRLRGVHYPDPTEDVALRYDDPSVNGVGRLTRMDDASGSTSYRYDRRGSLSEVVQRVGAATSVVGYGYDAAGRLARITYPSGIVVRYRRDAAGRVSGVDLDTGSPLPIPLASNVLYEPFGAARAWNLGNRLATTRDHDLQYRLERTITDGALRWELGYDPSGNVTGIEDLDDPGRSQMFHYDELDRLRSASGAYGARTYDLDPAGDRLALTFSGSSLGILPPAGRSRTSYVYGASNRLLRAEVNGATAAAYVYNGAGQRVRKVAGQTTIYHYGLDGLLLAELDELGGVIREYVYLNREPLAVIVGGLPEPAVYYYHDSHLGTPQVVTDEAGQIVWEADYTPYGAADILVDTIESNLRYPGQYFDAETGLSYNYFRDYDPLVGRYIQADPSGPDGGRNAYAYANGNPLREVDPSGLLSVSIQFGGSFHYGPGGASASSSVGIDSTGKICVQLSSCGQVGFGLQAGLGAGIVVSEGNFCEGDSTSEGIFAEAAAGIGGGASASRDSGGNRSAGGVTGVAGGGASAGKQFCQTRTVCFD